MEKKSYIVAVDVGSSEVVVAVGSMAEGGVINIECVVAEPTEGVTAGLVDNNQIVASALIRAREAAEQQVGVAITATPTMFLWRTPRTVSHSAM